MLRGNSPRRLARPRLTIGRRFTAVALIVVPALGVVALIGALGVGRMNAELSGLYDHEYRQTAAAASLARSLSTTQAAALTIVHTDAERRHRELHQTLARRVMPSVDDALDHMRSLSTGTGEEEEVEEVAAIEADWKRFERLHTSDAVLDSTRPEQWDERTAARLTALFDRMVGSANDLVAEESEEAKLARDRAGDRYDRTRLQLVGASVVALLATMALIAWLTRSIVPRAREYSRFAAEVAEGAMDAQLELRGNDELTELGELLNRMVAHRRDQQGRDSGQAEFAEALQMAEDEAEAYDLLSRHVERSLPETRATVLSRNNSDDRLEARTPLSDEDPLHERLKDAKPRSCLAVRSGEQYAHGTGDQPLIECELCGALGSSTCQPLLVGGEVMGSVLAMHDEQLDDRHRETMRMTVAQAAPVLANLRNLAVAEQRAGTDELTGLANQRASHESIKRLVAEAVRAGEPLSVVVMDLDRFKQINDLHGHAVGDEVLAAVGATLRATLRDHDFCGRFGGEEFIILLPRTDLAGGTAAAENLRRALETIQMSSIDRSITASFGVAAWPEHAGDADELVRSADRALYSAKSRGRNRVEVVVAGVDGPRPGAAADAAPNGAARQPVSSA